MELDNVQVIETDEFELPPHSHRAYMVDTTLPDHVRFYDIGRAAEAVKKTINIGDPNEGWRVIDSNTNAVVQVGGEVVLVILRDVTASGDPNHYLRTFLTEVAHEGGQTRRSTRVCLYSNS